MEVVAPGEVAAAPFALCPRYNLLAVGMTFSPAARGDAEEIGAARVDVLRLLRPSGEHNLGGALQVECIQRAPGLTKLTWSAKRDNDDDDDVDADFTLIDKQDIYPSGLLAGGFEDGTVRIWSAEQALLCDLKTISVTDKLKPLLILDKDPKTTKLEEANISVTIDNMYSYIKNKKIKWEDSDDDWQEIDDGSLKTFEWDLISKDESATEEMTLVMETHDLDGPVLGLSFNDLNPSWMASAARSERIYVHDVQVPFNSKRKLEPTKKLSEAEVGLEPVNSHITCLKWNKLSPCILASSGDAGVTKIWDVRSANKPLTSRQDRKTYSSDIEFSSNNPFHLAISTMVSPTVQIWDIRRFFRPMHQYASGDSGVVSLSWNRVGQLLTAHTNGGIKCYDVYNRKMLQEVDHEHSDLGATWTHSENVAATLSSEKRGVKLCEIGG